jgi:putative OmpL-like beta-barrel porin-2
MRSALWGALLWCVAAQAAAQGEPVTFEESQPVTVTGFAVASADWDRLARTNSFEANTISLSLFKPVGDWYLFGQLTTSLAGDGSVGIDIDHILIAWTPHSASQWTFEFGRLHAPLGFEQDDAPLNFLPTSSYNFQFARPSAFTGVIVRYTPSPHFGFVAAVANGWDIPLDRNRGKTGALRAEWIATDGLSIGVTGVYGPERDSTDGFQRTLFTPDLTLQQGPLILQAEANLGSERNGLGGSNKWVGGVALAFLRLTRSIGVAFRYDHLDDTKAGVVTGVPQVLRSFTMGPIWFYRSAQQGIFSNIEHTTFHLPQIGLRAALRVNYSSVPFFANPTGGLERGNTQAVVQLVYIF